MKTLAVLTVLAALSDLVFGLPGGAQTAVAWLPIAMGVGAGLNYLSGRRGQDQDRALSEEELAFIKQKYADRAGMRTMGMGRLSQPLPMRPDLSQDFADPSNPFYKPPSALGFGGGAPNPMPGGNRQAMPRMGTAMPPRDPEADPSGQFDPSLYF